MSKWTKEAKELHKAKQALLNKKGVKLISKSDVEEIRNTRRNLLTGDVAEEQIAPDKRASCRCCGQKILKGEARLCFTHDFIGNGSACTAGTAYMHTDCEYKQD